MIGSTLTRFSPERFCVFDTETNGVSLRYSLPWELSYAVGTLKGGLSEPRTHLIRWPNYRISDELAAKVHFDWDRYNREAKPPEEVWAEFSKVLYDPEVRAVGHNILGYDANIVNAWRRAMGLPSDHSWVYRPLIDTNALAKAKTKGWTPDISSPEAFVAWQYRVASYVETGFKSSLGHTCREFGLEYDEKVAHSAEYDIGRNWLVFKELVWALEV